MDNLRSRITAARDIAVAREGDFRIKEFLGAMTIRQEGGDDKPIALEVACHFRSWQKSIMPSEAAQLGPIFQAELADTIAGWVRGAINQNLLSLSDPPRAVGKEAYSVGAIVTYVYDKDFMLVGKRWG